MQNILYDMMLNTMNRGRRLLGPRWIDPARFSVETPDDEINCMFAHLQTEIESRLSLPFGLRLMKTRWLQSTEDAGSTSAAESSLAAQFIKWFDPELALKIIEPFFDNQSSEGKIPAAVMPLSISSAPALPFLAEAVLSLSRLSHVKNLPSLFERSERFCNWLTLHKKEADGMFIHADREWFASDPYIHQIRHECPEASDCPHDVRSVALNSMIVYQMQCMAQLTRSLKLDREARKYEEAANQLRENIARKLWDEESGFFYDRAGDRMLRTAALTGFLPLAADVPTKGQVSRMLELLPKMYERMNVLIQQPGIAPVFTLAADGLTKYGRRREAAALSLAAINYIRSLGKAKKFFLPRLVSQLLLVRNVIGFHRFSGRYVLNPCLPESWAGGTVKIRMAENSHTIYMSLRDNQKVECRITSSSGGQINTSIDNYSFRNFPFPIESSS
jgi:hypothetical protein